MGGWVGEGDRRRQGGWVTGGWGDAFKVPVSTARTPRDGATVRSMACKQTNKQTHKQTNKQTNKRTNASGDDRPSDHTWRGDMMGSLMRPQDAHAEGQRRPERKGDAVALQTRRASKERACRKDVPEGQGVPTERACRLVTWPKGQGPVPLRASPTYGRSHLRREPTCFWCH